MIKCLIYDQVRFFHYVVQLIFNLLCIIEMFILQITPSFHEKS